MSFVPSLICPDLAHAESEAVSTQAGGAHFPAADDEGVRVKSPNLGRDLWKILPTDVFRPIVDLVSVGREVKGVAAAAAEEILGQTVHLENAIDVPGQVVAPQLYLQAVESVPLDPVFEAPRQVVPRVSGIEIGARKLV